MASLLHYTSYTAHTHAIYTLMKLVHTYVLSRAGLLYVIYMEEKEMYY